MKSMAKDVLNKSKLTETQDNILKRCMGDNTKDGIIYSVSEKLDFIHFDVALYALMAVGVALICIDDALCIDHLFFRSVICWVCGYLIILALKLKDIDMWNKTFGKIF